MQFGITTMSILNHQCTSFIHTDRKLSVTERTLFIEHHLPYSQFRMPYYLHGIRIRQNFDGTLPVVIHLASRMNPRHHDIGIGSIPGITTMIKSQSKDLLLLLIFRFSMINAVPRSRLYLLAQKEISTGGKDITNSIVQYPFGRIIDEISFFHH